MSGRGVKKCAYAPCQGTTARTYCSRACAHAAMVGVPSPERAFDPDLQRLMDDAVERGEIVRRPRAQITLGHGPCVVPSPGNNVRHAMIARQQLDLIGAYLGKALLLIVLLAAPGSAQTHPCDWPSRTTPTPATVGTPMRVGFCSEDAALTGYRVLLDGTVQPGAGPLTKDPTASTDGFYFYVTPTFLQFTAGPHTVALSISNASGASGVTAPVVIEALPAPVDCVLSEWSVWSAWSSWAKLSPILEQRSRTRTRTEVTAPVNGGALCASRTGTETESRAVVLVPMTPSPDGTRVPPATEVVDATGHPWTIASTGLLLRDGVGAYNNWSASIVASCGGVIRLQDRSGIWYSWKDSVGPVKDLSDPCASGPPPVPPVDTACAPPLGAEAASVIVTRWEATTGRPGSRMRVNYQLAGKSPIVAIAIRLDGAVVATVSGSNLTDSAGTWFTAPAAGTHKLTVAVQNQYGCAREAVAPFDVVTK